MVQLSRIVDSPGIEIQGFIFQLFLIFFTNKQESGAFKKVHSSDHYLRPLLSSLIILFFWTLFSCKNKGADIHKHTSLPDFYSLDSSEHKVAHKIEDENIEFDYSDFNNLKSNKHYDRFFAGYLSLPTGQVVCTDPLYRELGLPQSWTVEPGNYPAYLYIALDDDFNGRVAYAELAIKNEVPAKWKMSLIPEHLLAGPTERNMNGMYPVENGLSSFSDYATFKIYEQEIDDFYSINKNGNFYNDILQLFFKKNAAIPKSSRGEDWANYKPKKAKGNIIMFGSGWGDGLYPRYVGYDKNNNVVKLITDFIRVNKNPGEE